MLVMVGGRPAESAQWHCGALSALLPSEAVGAGVLAARTLCHSLSRGVT